VKFFFDCNIARPIARAIGNLELNHRVVHQLDDGRFEPSSEDTYIINTLAAEDPKPIWITHDLSQRRNPEERAALQDSGMTIFFWRRNRLTPHHQALKMIAVWPAVVDSAVSA
jgi:hypothetical protein